MNTHILSKHAQQVGRAGQSVTMVEIDLEDGDNVTEDIYYDPGIRTDQTEKHQINFIKCRHLCFNWNLDGIDDTWNDRDNLLRPQKP